jgi:hypothetical protein
MQLLSETDRRRVELYMKLVDGFAGVFEEVEALVAAGKAAKKTPEELEQSLQPLFDFAEEFMREENQRKLPTRDMLRDYAIEELHKKVDNLTEIVRDLY